MMFDMMARPLPNDLPPELDEALRSVAALVGDDGTATVTETPELRSLRKAGAFELWQPYISGKVRVSLTYDAEVRASRAPSRDARSVLGTGAEIAGRFVGGVLDSMGD